MRTIIFCGRISFPQIFGAEQNPLTASSGTLSAVGYLVQLFLNNLHQTWKNARHECDYRKSFHAAGVAGWLGEGSGSRTGWRYTAQLPRRAGRVHCGHARGRTWRNQTEGRRTQRWESHLRWRNNKFCRPHQRSVLQPVTQIPHTQHTFSTSSEDPGWCFLLNRQTKFTHWHLHANQIHQNLPRFGAFGCVCVWQTSQNTFRNEPPKKLRLLAQQKGTAVRDVCVCLCTMSPFQRFLNCPKHFCATVLALNTFSASDSGMCMDGYHQRMSSMRETLHQGSFVVSLFGLVFGDHCVEAVLPTKQKWFWDRFLLFAFHAALRWKHSSGCSKQVSQKAPCTMYFYP